MARTKSSGRPVTAKVESSTTSNRSSLKRAVKDEDEDHEASQGSAKKRAVNKQPVSGKKSKSTTKQRASNDPYEPINLLVDSLRPDLLLVFIGLNPGLMTAATGHAYSHPSNLFWKLLHWSGVTSIRHHPSETRDLMDLYSVGNTNICERATRSGDGLSKQEMIEGAAILDVKIAEFRPEAVCIVGKSIWQTIYQHKTGKQLKNPDFHYGWQDEKLWLGRTANEDGTLEWVGAKTFVATTTSGLAASTTPAQKLEVWKPLGEWVQEKRKMMFKQEDDVKLKVEVEE